MLKTIMAESYWPTGKEATVCDGRYLLRKKIGHGSFGDIYMAYDTVYSTNVAVKLERKSIHYPQLQYEMSVYQILYPFRPSGGQNRNPASSSKVNPFSPRDNLLIPGIPRAHQFVKEAEYSVMVMDLCGPSLEDLFNYCHRRFSLKTVLMLVEQMLHRIEYVHSRGFLHRDIKPENFVFGRGPLGHVLHMIDFGLAKPYLDKKTHQHVAFSDKKPLTGTARYCACNAHRGYEQSRRDDLESIGFLLVYFIKGVLPWQGIQGKDQRVKTQRIGEKKMATTLESLCEGLPSAFYTYLTYCRRLDFPAEPDYEYLRELFRAVAREYRFTVPLGAGGLPVPIPVHLGENGGLGGEPNNYFNSSSVHSPMGRTVTVSAINDDRRGAGKSKSNRQEDSVNESYETIHVMDDDPMEMLYSPRLSSRAGNNSTISSHRLGANRGTRSVGRLYDWHFDWFGKRTEEVKSYKQNRVKPASFNPPTVGSKARLEPDRGVGPTGTSRRQNDKK